MTTSADAPTQSPMHDRISVSGLCFPDFDLSATLDALAQLGVGATTLQTAVARDTGWDAGLERIRSAGVRVAGFVGPFPKDLANRDTWATARAEYIETLDAAAALGSPAVYSVTGPQVTDTRAESVALFAEFIAPVATHALAVGVALAVEPTVTEYSWVSFIHTLDHVLELNAVTGMSVCLDLYHVWNDPCLADFLDNHLDLVALVQVGDCVMEDGRPVKVVTGEGIIPLPDVLTQVLAAGYTGVFDVEQFGPEMQAEGTVAAARRAVLAVEKAFLPVPHA